MPHTKKKTRGDLFFFLPRICVPSLFLFPVPFALSSTWTRHRHRASVFDGPEYTTSWTAGTHDALCLFVAPILSLSLFSFRKKKRRRSTQETRVVKKSQPCRRTAESGDYLAADLRLLVPFFFFSERAPLALDGPCTSVLEIRRICFQRKKIKVATCPSRNWQTATLATNGPKIRRKETRAERGRPETETPTWMRSDSRSGATAGV